MSSEAELLMETYLRELFGDGERIIAAEFLFHPQRKWRFDFCVPELRLAIEIEGGIWTRGRHTRGNGFLEDCRKYASALALGWTVFRFPVEMVIRGEALEFLKSWKEMRQA